MFCQQFEQFLAIYLHNLIEFIRPTSYYIKNRSKANRFFTMYYTKSGFWKMKCWFFFNLQRIFGEMIQHDLLKYKVG